MSKRIKYPNGDEGVASDEVAAILAKRPGHKIVGDVTPEKPKELSEGARKKLIDKIVAAGGGTAESLADLPDAELIEKGKAAK